MNTRILSILFVGFLLGACSGAPRVTDSDLDNCPSQGSWFCKGNPQAPTANIITNGKKLKVKPYCINANVNSELLFRVVPKDSQPAGTVRIIPKDSKSSHDDWLAADNSSDQNIIKIVVPPGTDPTLKYYYGVKINGKCVDPRVHVELN